MTQPQRVRVTSRATQQALRAGRGAAPTATHAASLPAGAPDDGADAARLAVLLRVHRRLALRTMALTCAGLFGLPLLFAALPDLTGSTALGVPALWWLLGVAGYPLLLLVARRHARRADRLDKELAR